MSQNDFSSKALVLLIALQGYEFIPDDLKGSLLHGLFWLTDQLLEATSGRPEHTYEDASLRTIQAYIDAAFTHPAQAISGQAIEECRRILPGIPDEEPI